MQRYTTPEPCIYYGTIFLSFCQPHAGLTVYFVTTNPCVTALTLHASFTASAFKNLVGFRLAGSAYKMIIRYRCHAARNIVRSCPWAPACLDASNSHTGRGSCLGIPAGRVSYDKARYACYKFFIAQSLKRVRSGTKPNILKLILLHPNRFVVKLRDQDTTGRTGQDDGRYQGRNDRCQRVDRGSCLYPHFCKSLR